MPNDGPAKYCRPALTAGTGKTYKLTEIALLAAKQYGPKKVAAVTYTRPAARELKERIAEALGIRTDDKTLAAEIPYVGTLHSVAWHLLGCPPILKPEHFRAFCDEAHIEPPKNRWSSTPDEIEAFWTADSLLGREEGAIFQRLLSLARHKQAPIEDCMDAIPLGSWHITAERMALIAAEYQRWKQEHRLIDFEDVLEEAVRVQPPVEVLLLDESQDNSSLMWSVIDAWLPRTKLFVTAGDPGQALYSFNGGDPLLFADRPGDWKFLSPSRRLSAEAAEYAKQVLSYGWDDPRFQGWTGIGGEPVDGTTFYLARTNGLLAPIRQQLEDEGEPYVHFAGRAHSPWESNSANAYRTLTRLMRGELVPTAELRLAAKQVSTELLPTEHREYVKQLLKGGYGEMMDAADAVKLFGDLAGARRLLDHADYMAAIERRYGFRGLVMRPKTTLGTIHASKGMEADVVNLVSSWATLPARALWDVDGRRSESCVAYVGCSRHRFQLNFVPVYAGTDYPWPGR